MAEQRKYRKFTAQQKLEIVLAGLRGDRSVRDVCREHEIAEALYYGWRDKILEGGRLALAGKDDQIAHRRGGYRDPESQAFIESWFSKLKERLLWRSEFETLDEARAAIAAYVEAYHHQPTRGWATGRRRR
ncbi:MAG TPA: transposase [Solirubrobacterales bacterium]|nr:transposase [Solirubrobacterales bacterium]